MCLVWIIIAAINVVIPWIHFIFCMVDQGAGSQFDSPWTIYLIYLLYPLYGIWIVASFMKSNRWSKQLLQLRWNKEAKIDLNGTICSLSFFMTRCTHSSKPNKLSPPAHPHTIYWPRALTGWTLTFIPWQHRFHLYYFFCTLISKQIFLNMLI